ncbi:hypothetical protein FISHEDRAFT_73622 [Fistulina hepatica ATCC 64428]|uniref:BTB domain-containing protein n=1 Tax=Fistulina hepatica ATCC 64428 TaxID=1128425 RepID=A0A0D7ACQ5_9AGAR|nr:hypothetical protein FISHEDRAFT_73622 [Fistulina hepatica ATCC 64428]
MVDSDSGPRGVKRTRSDEDNSSSGSSNGSAQQTRLASAKRSSAFWYSDGSLIIHASSTLFCIHRGFLAKNSSFFDDLTTFACIADELHLDGCPVVEVSDSPEEWAELLGALYNPVYFLATSENRRADFVRSYARLVSISTKYAFATIRAQAIRKLEECIPTSLVSVPPAFGLLPNSMLIGQFRKSNALMFLPYLYYVAMTETTADALWSIPNDVFSAEDKAIVFRARLNLQSSMRRTSLRYNYCSIPTIQECTCLANSHTTSLPPPYDQTLFRAHVLSNRSEFIRIIGQRQGLCANHIAVLMTLHKEGRAQAWMELPTAFGLEPWDKLKSIQDIDNQPTSSHETSDS